MFEEETLGRDRYGEDCAPAQELVFSEHTPNTTGRIGSWTWLPFRPCRGRGTGHGTPESEKTAFSETSFASSIITVMKEHTAVRGCLTLDSSIWETEKQVPLKDPSNRAGLCMGREGWTAQ